MKVTPFNFNRTPTAGEIILVEFPPEQQAKPVIVIWQDEFTKSMDIIDSSFYTILGTVKDIDLSLLADVIVQKFQDYTKDIQPQTMKQDLARISFVNELTNNFGLL